MQKLETRNGTLMFVEVPESSNHKFTLKGEYELLGEVTKEGITFDCDKYVDEHYLSLTIKSEYYFRRAMQMNLIELREGNKFIVLKEK